MECISGQQENSRGLDMWWPAAYSVDMHPGQFISWYRRIFFLFVRCQSISKLLLGNAVLLVMGVKATSVLSLNVFLFVCDSDVRMYIVPSVTYHKGKWSNMWLGQGRREKRWSTGGGWWADLPSKEECKVEESSIEFDGLWMRPGGSICRQKLLWKWKWTCIWILARLII